MSYTLTGARYIGTGSLPTPVLGYDAVDTSTGNLYAANSSATGWNLIGNVNYTNLGLLPLTGGTVTGNIAGPTGWAPNDSPNFTTTAKLGGLTLATQADLANTSTSILNSIAPKITSAIASTSAAITVKSNIARGKGVLTFATGTRPAAQTIPLPQYSDGTTASEADCMWIVSVLNMDFIPTGLSGGERTYLLFTNGSDDVAIDPTSTRTFAAYLYSTTVAWNQVKIGYFIEGIRS